MLTRTLPYLADDLLFLAEVEHACRDLRVPLLFRASERIKLERIERHGTDRGGYSGRRPWRGGKGRLHEEVILATDADDIRRGALDRDYSTSFKKLPAIADPLLLVYDARALTAVGDREYAFSSDPKRALLRVFDVRHVPMPRGWMPSDEGLAYRALVERAGRRVVEVGSWLGRSASYVARVASLTCVDHFSGSSDRYDTSYRETLAAIDVRAAFAAHVRALGAEVRLLVEPSVTAATRFGARSLDLVFLDASHDEAAVRADVEAWRPKIRSGGILAGHDHDDDHPGVVRAVRALDPEVGPGGLYHSVVP